MPLTNGTRIDRYEITGMLGKGAMGEVYRAHDQRLGRDVAVKVLPAEFSSDPERLRRFDLEARTAGTLNHPNVVAIFDVGTHEGAPFVVSELLDGETLRARLDGQPLPPRKVLEYGAKVARGLAAAHARGVVHRDLKPENLFVTHDGQVKILDFGLAKLTRDDRRPGSEADSLVATQMTEMGRVLGTVGYMAPEQVRGEAADHRADIFALGCVLFEMATGQQPFHRDTVVESMAAIVRDDLPGFPAEFLKQAPGLIPLVRRCVEKLPGERFESARDLAFSLEVLDQAGPASGVATATAAAEIAYQRITFRRGAIWTARFTPDGHSVVYSASWEGKPLELFWAHIGNPEARTLGFRDTDLLSVASSNELAVLLRSEFVTSFDRSGTLARVPPMGGAARELLHDVHSGDWSPDGQQLAIVREKDGVIRLEYPIGNVLYKTSGWISQIRISPDGNLIAFADHPSRNNDFGVFAVVDRKGERRVLTEDWGTIRGLAWSADGREVWFTADPGGSARGLYAVSLEGRTRKLLQLASNLTIHDVSRDGRVLVCHGQERAGVNGRAAGEERERDLSWLDWSLLQDLSPDGHTLLIDESAEGGGPTGSVYLRPMDGSPAIRLGDGSARSMSPDGRWVVGGAVGMGNQGKLQLLPTGVGEPREIPTGNLFCHVARWMADGRHLIVAAHEPDRGVRLYRLDIESGEAVAFSPEGVHFAEFHLLRGGDSVAALTADQEYRVYPIDGGDSRPVPGLQRNDRIVEWAAGSSVLFVYNPNELPARIYRVDLESGQRTLQVELTPPDPTGIYRIGRVRSNADVSVYAYSYYMHIVDLNVISGLR